MTPTEGKYWREWRSACALRGWKQSDTALRHAMHVAALGREKSHTVFNRHDWDRIFPMLQRCADPDDLDVVMLVEQYVRHDAAQAAHVPTVKPGKPRGQTVPRRRYASQYERMTAEDDPGERKRLCYVISRLFMPAYVAEVCFDRWEARDWRELPLPHLAELRDLLKRRLGKWLTKVKSGEIQYRFGFSIANTNPRSSAPFLSNEAIVAILLDRGTPVDMRERGCVHVHASANRQRVGDLAEPSNAQRVGDLVEEPF